MHRQRALPVAGFQPPRVKLSVPNLVLHGPSASELARKIPAKPDGQYFEAALRRLSVQANETLFIDDDLPSVIAARSCGINAEVFHLREGVERLRSILLDRGVLP